MRTSLALLASLCIVACSSEEDEAYDTSDTVVEDASDTVDSLLDLSGSWSGNCTFADGDFGKNATVSLELESSQEYGTYVGMDGRLLSGTGSVSVTYLGEAYGWETRVEGVSGEQAVLLVAFEVTDQWLLEIDGSATDDSISGSCGAAAWSFELEAYVYVWGDLSMVRD